MFVVFLANIKSETHSNMNCFPFFDASLPPPQLQVKKLDSGIENVGRKRLILAQYQCFKAIDTDQFT